MSNETSTSAPDPRVRGLKGLALVALVVVVAAIIGQSLSRGKTESAFRPHLAFPGFETAMADVVRIEIRSKEATFTLARSEDAKSWGVVERGNYPVRAEALRALLWGLGDMDLVERKTARASRHETVGLVAPEDGGNAVRIRALGAGGTPMAAVLFGNPEGGETLDGSVRTWLRMDGDDQTWIGEGRLDVEASLEEWMDLDFLDVDASRIAAVHTTPGSASQGSAAFTIAKPDRDSYNFELLDLSDGEAMSGPTVANGLGRALIAMTFSDAMPAAKINFDDAAVARYETFDGLALTIRTQRHEENFWITLNAKTIPVAANNGENIDDGVDEAAEAAMINAHGSGWAFRIAEWKGDQLTVAKASMLKQKSENNE